MKPLFVFSYFLCVLLDNIFTSPTFFKEKCDDYKRQLRNLSHSWNGEGTSAGIGDFPHATALAYPYEGKYNFRCGATLISAKYVIFPAHCAVSLDRIQPKFARMSSIDIPIEVPRIDPQTDYLIKKITVHPSYNVRKRSNNIALAELTKEVTFTESVKPACLYPESQVGNDTLILSEWGENTNISHLVLHKTRVFSVPTEECSVQYTVRYRKSVASGQICASSTNKDTCEGELGGPLQIYDNKFFTLVGVPSHGGMCGTATPTVYTFVYHYLDWIKGVAWNFE